MKSYLDIVKKVLETGEKAATRQGPKAYTVAGVMFEHDMSEGFPLLTTKKVPLRLVATELECFINGITDKKWFQERNNHIWDEWANPKKAPYGQDEESKKRMREERDLGPIYGFQWRHFNAPYKGHAHDYTGEGFDQLKKIVETLKKNPRDRRMIVSGWNPMQVEEMSLPPCFYAFQVVVVGDKLNLLWNQRSVDVMLGLPFDIASHALMLHLLAKESGFKEGRLVGFLGDVHLFENHVEGAKEQLSRDHKKYPLPKIEIQNWKSIFDWKAEDVNLIGYESHPRISFEIAI